MKSRYDPTKHHRRSIRLRGYDYASPGAYFVTMVTHDRECLFGNDIFRRVAEYNWRALSRHFPNVILDEWIVMPNHIHGIIVIIDDASHTWMARRGEAFASARVRREHNRSMPTKVSRNQELANASPLQAHGVPPGALGAIVGNFKSITTRRINKIRHTHGVSIWQRNYYEHIVRDDGDLKRIREYIEANPFPGITTARMQEAELQKTIGLSTKGFGFQIAT